jgi:leader peptidase (prepilin peptidase)/N-methyltransferase
MITLKVVFIIAIIGVLATISIIDVRTKRIPDMLNLALLACGVAAIWIFPETSVAARFAGMFCVSLPMFLLAAAVKGSFGVGDVKLMASAGFLLGWRGVITAFCAGAILGGICGAALIIARRQTIKGHFAFGPCLAVGILVSLLASQNLYNALTDLLVINYSFAANCAEVITQHRFLLL